MKILRIFLSIVLVIMLAIVGLSAYVALNARVILVTQLEKNLGLRIQLSSLKFRLPDTIVAEALVISDTLKVDRLVITPSVVGFLKGELIFNSILLEKPQITITRKPDNSLDFGLPPVASMPAAEGAQKPSEVAVQKKPGQRQTPKIYVNRLMIRDGVVTFVDQGLAGQPAFLTKCSSLNLEVFRPSFLDFFRMQFNGSGRLLSQKEEEVGQLTLSGWVDIVHYDMDAKAEIKNGRLLYFSPYYKPYFKKDLKSGDVAVTAIALAKNNDMTVDCHIALANVTLEGPSGEEGSPAQEQASAENFGFMVFDSLLGPEGSMSIDFTIRTRMDNPKFENVKFKGTFLKNRIEATFSKPPQQTVEDFKKMGEQFEAIGKQFKDIFKNK